MDLSVEWKPMDQISALELLAVSLIHCNTVSFPIEYLYFIHHAHVTSTEATFSCDGYCGLQSIIHSNSFIVVSVLVDDIGSPDFVDFLFIKYIERLFLLQVMI